MRETFSNSRTHFWNMSSRSGTSSTRSRSVAPAHRADPRGIGSASLADERYRPRTLVYQVYGARVRQQPLQVALAGFLRSRSRLSAFLRETWDASATTGLCCSTRGATLLKRFVAPSPPAVIPGGPPAASRDAPETPGKVDVVC